MTGAPSIIYIKTVLELFTTAIFATMPGFSVMTIRSPLLAVQIALTTLVVFIRHLITPDMMAGFSCAGELIMMATGLQIGNIKAFPVANMLSGLILVMPFSALWAKHFV